MFNPNRMWIMSCEEGVLTKLAESVATLCGRSAINCLFKGVYWRCIPFPDSTSSHQFGAVWGPKHIGRTHTEMINITDETHQAKKYFGAYISNRDAYGHIHPLCEQDFAQWAHNVKMTSYQRRCDVITSHRRWYDVILMLCACWVASRL